MSAARNRTADDLSAEGFDAVKARLEEIADLVGEDEVDLDEALDLFEEAVALGTALSDLLEEDVLVPADDPNASAADVTSDPSPQVA